MSKSKKNVLKNLKSSDYSESDNNFTESDSIEKSVRNKISVNNVNNSTDQNDPNNKNTTNVANDEDIKRKAKEAFIQTDFFEKVIKYVKTDNLIRKETADFREKINTMKEEKQELEKFILRYLEIQEENVININGSGKLTKYESIRKKGINKDIIQQAISDQLKKEKLVTDDKKLKELVEATYNIMEGKREQTVKTVLKRTFLKEKKEKKPKENKIKDKPIKNATKDEKLKKKNKKE